MFKNLNDWVLIFDYDYSTVTLLAKCLGKSTYKNEKCEEEYYDCNVLAYGHREHF